MYCLRMQADLRLPIERRRKSVVFIVFVYTSIVLLIQQLPACCGWPVEGIKGGRSWCAMEGRLCSCYEGYSNDNSSG